MKFCYLFFCLVIARLLSANPFIWAADHTNNKVLVIDGATNTIFQTISQTTGSFDGPLSVAITPDSLFAYVFNAEINTVSVINTATYQQETPLIDLTPSGGSTTSGNIVISPNGAFAYVTNAERGVVSIIDTSTNTLIHTSTGFSEPIGLAFSPDSAFAYVVDFTDGAVYMINTSNYLISAAFPAATFNEPEEIAISANGVFAYLTNLGSSTVSVLNLATFPPTILKTISLPAFSDPEAIVLSPDGTRAYVAGFSTSQIFTINTLTNTLIGSTASMSQGILAPMSLAIAPGGSILYIGNFAGPILAFNIGTDTLITTVPNTSGDGFHSFNFAIQQSSARQFARPSNRRP